MHGFHLRELLGARLKKKKKQKNPQKRKQKTPLIFSMFATQRHFPVYW